MPHDHSAFDFADDTKPKSGRGMLAAFKAAGKALVAKAKHGAAAKILPAMLLAAAALTAPQAAKAQASLTQITLTGTVSSGTDTTGVFGPTGGLSGKSFTLVYTYDPTQGTPHFTACSGGGSDYYTDIRNSGSDFPATATLQIGGGQPYPFGGAGESSVTSWALRYADTCGSTPSEAGVGITTNYSGLFGGGAGVGTGAVSPDIFPPSGGSLSPNADWSSDVNPAVPTNSSDTIQFSVGITGAETKTASGYLAPTNFQVTQLGLDVNALTNGGDCGCGNPTEQLFQQSQDMGQTAGKDFKNFVGDPVNPATGNMFEAATDYATAGPNALAFKRYYNGMANQVISLRPSTDTLSPWPKNSARTGARITTAICRSAPPSPAPSARTDRLFRSGSTAAHGRRPRASTPR